MSIDSEKLRQAKQAEFGSYFEYSTVSIRPEETTAITKIKNVYVVLYIVKTGAFYIDLISPVIFVKEVRYIRLTKCAIDFGGRRYITTSKIGAMTAKLVNGVNHRIVGPSYLQVIYPLISHFNVFR